MASYSASSLQPAAVTSSRSSFCLRNRVARRSQLVDQVGVSTAGIAMLDFG
jgi:hypothetical protein